MEHIRENLQTPLLGEYDVIVCGGGIGGLTAAVSAARMGKSVLVLEKSVLLGGLATIGLISWYEPLCDGHGKRIMNGMAYELLRLCIRHGFHTLDEAWLADSVHGSTGKRMCTHFSHSLCEMALDGWLLESGAELLLDTVVTAPRLVGDRIDGVFVENKDGRGYYRCKTLVDATGDADIAIRSGLKYENGVNYLTYIGYYTDVEQAEKAAREENIFHVRKWMNSGADLWGRGHPQNIPYYIGVDAKSLTDFVLRGRARLFEKIKEQPAFRRDFAVLPAMPQYRKTRRIIGMKTLEEADAGKHFDTSIAAVTDFSKRGSLYEIPYETLYNSKVKNLFVAGRAISSTGWAWDVTRVIPAVAATGQACGTAAALCSSGEYENDTLPVTLLQDKLLHQGAWLHF